MPNHKPGPRPRKQVQINENLISRIKNFLSNYDRDSINTICEKIGCSTPTLMKALKNKPITFNVAKNLERNLEEYLNKAEKIYYRKLQRNCRKKEYDLLGN